MQKEFYFDDNSQMTLWDDMWSTRTIDEELEACDLEKTVRDSFLTYIPHGGKVIDGGCGFGKWVIYLNKQGYDILGVDSNEIAIAKLKDYDRLLKVELGDIQNICYPDNSFDAYISMGVVEHFEEGPEKALQEAYRVLKPEGLIFVSVPTINIIRRFVRRPFRILINALPMSLRVLKLNWRKSNQSGFVPANSPARPIVPQRAIYRLAGMYLRHTLTRIQFNQQETWHYHFAEYRYSPSEVQNFLKQSGFEILNTVPHDFYGKEGYGVGLAVDFPFLAVENGVNFRLNYFGSLLSRALNSISPWIACSSVLCVGRSLKGNHD